MFTVSGWWSRYDHRFLCRGSEISKGADTAAAPFMDLWPLNR